MRMGLVGGALVWALVGCGGGSGDPDAADPNKVTLSGAVFDFAGLAPLEGVEVCIFEDTSIPCATSDVNGRYAVLANKNTDVVIDYQVEGYARKLRHWRVADDDDDLSIFNMQTDARVAELYQQAGVTAVAGTAIVAVQVHGEDAGATGALVPSAGEGPFYTTTGEDFDPELTSTTSEGLGVIAFANVPPGDYSIVVSNQDFTCTSAQTPGTEASSVAIHAIADAITENGIRCE